MRVIVAGGGIGGLTAAVALRHHGLEPLVLEQSQTLTEIGAGIQVAANAVLVLRELGLEDEIDRIGVRTQSYDYRDLRTGRMLYQASVGAEAAARYGAPLYSVHRADLVGFLGAALPPGTIRFGARCVGFSQTPERVEVRLQTGEILEADALVGCDGIHSVVRSQLRGPEEKHFSDILMWRSLVPADRLEGIGLEERGNYWVGPGRTLITYWVRPKSLYSILASVPAGEVRRESWTESGDIDEMLESFRDAEPRARRMLAQVKSCFITGMYYRDPIDTWSDGRVTLLGDAAHAMVPFLAAGAGQSIEDAWVLARVLSRRRDDVAGALREYQERRVPRTTRIQAGSRAAVKLVHESAEARIRDRNGRWKGMSRIDPLGETSRGLAWDYDVVRAVEEPPGEVLNVTGLREGERRVRPQAQKAFEMWKHAFRPEDVARGHDGLREAYDRFLTASFPPPAGLEVDEAELGDVPAFRVARSGGAGGGTVLHFHGGGYMIGSARGSLEYAGRLADLVDGGCWTVDYRLAPEHPYPAALDDAVCAYRALVAGGVEPASLLLSGESAGGGLAIALALALRTAGDPLPAAIFAASPFADLTLSGTSMRTFDGRDPTANRDLLTYMGASYFQGHEPTDPLVSPLFGDLAGLPPMFLTAVEGEVLLDDTTRLAQRARRAGVEASLRVVEDSVHVYPLFAFLPETRSTLAEVANWARPRLKTKTRTPRSPADGALADDVLRVS